jgi:hypothetical protein
MMKALDAIPDQWYFVLVGATVVSILRERICHWMVEVLTFAEGISTSDDRNDWQWKQK